METIRLTLIFLHTFIMIFATVNLHPHLSFIANGKDHPKQNAAIVRYITDLLCILLYHTTSIVAVWFARRYGAGMIHASGVLLIGELLQVITVVIQYALDTRSIEYGEVFFNMIHNITLWIAITLTFRLARRISKHEKDLMQVELLADTINDISMSNIIEPTFI